MLKIRYGKKINLGTHHHLFAKNLQIIIKDNSKINLQGVRFSRNDCITANSDGNLIIGNNVTINRNVNIICKDKIEINEGVSIAPNVCIYDHDHYFDKNGFKKGKFKTSPISIGANTWIGAGAIILRGTTIGENCVIAAGTVVKGNIPNNSIVKNDRTIDIIPLK